MTAPQRIAAFEDIYRTGHKRLLRKLRRQVGPDEAPDLAHDKTRESNLGFVALASVKLWIPFVHEA